MLDAVQEERMKELEEGLRHIEEFRYYYNLGPSRTAITVAKAINKNFRTVQNWKYEERWDELVNLWDIKCVEEARKSAVVEAVRVSNSYRELIGLLVDKFKDNIKKGKVDVKSVAELDKLARLETDILEKLVNGYVPLPKDIDSELNKTFKVDINFVGADGDGDSTEE